MDLDEKELSILSLLVSQLQLDMIQVKIWIQQILMFYLTLLRLD